MQLKTFVIPVLSPERSEGDVNAFLKGHRVLKVERHFVNDDSGSYWAVLVEYAEAGHADSVHPLKRGDNKEDYNLSSDELSRYERYRKIRNELSMRKGVQGKKGTVLLMTFLVKAARLVHHWDGSFDGAAALTASKERVPADSTRFVHAKIKNFAA